MDWSAGVRGDEESRTRRTQSASRRASRARVTPIFSMASAVSRMPAVSESW